MHILYGQLWEEWAKQIHDGSAVSATLLLKEKKEERISSEKFKIYIREWNKYISKDNDRHKSKWFLPQHQNLLRTHLWRVQRIQALDFPGIRKAKTINAD